MYCLYYIVHNTTTDHATGNVFTDISYKQWRIQKFWKGGGRKTIYQSRRHLSQMHRTKYMPFTRKKRLFEKKIWANRGGRPNRPLLNPPLAMNNHKLSQFDKTIISLT